MRLNEFTLDEGMMDREYNGSRRQPIETEQAFEFIRSNCREAIESTPIYRGVKRSQTDGAKIVDTAGAAPRLSANTHSYVGMLMDNLPGWRGYPKRNKSLICTNYQDYAQSYGAVHRMFPINGTKIGICQDVDVWSSFNGFYVPNLNEALAELSKHFLHSKLSETPGEFFSQIELITEHLDQIGGIERASNKHLYKPLITMSSRLGTNDLKTILAKLMDPVENEFKLTSIENFFNITGRREVWFEGKAVMLPESLWQPFSEFIQA